MPHEFISDALGASTAVVNAAEKLGLTTDFASSLRAIERCES